MLLTFCLISLLCLSGKRVLFELRGFPLLLDALFYSRLLHLFLIIFLVSVYLPVHCLAKFWLVVRSCFPLAYVISYAKNIQEEINLPLKFSNHKLSYRCFILDETLSINFCLMFY